MTRTSPRDGGQVVVRVGRVALPGHAVRGSDRTARRVGILLELRAPDGRSGWGEASPLPGYAGETPERAAAALLALAASPAARSDLSDILREPGAAGARLAGALRPGGPTDAASAPLRRLLAAPLPASARAALVAALFDFAGRTTGAPVRGLLGAPRPGPDGLASVPLNALVPLGAPRDAARAARAAVGRGIGTLKTKLGPAETAAEDLDALRAIRQAVGPEVAIRLDANGLWSVDEACRLLPVLAAEIGPEYVEEPVPPDRLADLPDLPVRLAADESLRDPERAARLLDSGALAVIVLKPGPLGGLDRCVALAREAATRGLATVVTHAFEGPVGHAAACELALALRNGAAAAPGVLASETLACGLDAHPVLAASPDVTVPQLRSASVVPASVSGLGVDPRPLLAPDAPRPAGEA